MSKYVVMTASAKVPGSWRGRYAKVALALIADPANPPKMISERARGMERIVWLRNRLFVGTSARCEFERALAEANAEAAALNAIFDSK